MLFETHRLSDLKMIEAIGLDHDRVDERFGPEGVYFYLGSVGSFNYGHWLVDDLPRLEGFFVLRRRHPGRIITILLPGYDPQIDEVRRRMIALTLGRDDRWRAVFYDRTRVYAFPHLYFATPCSQEPYGKSPEAVAAVRSRLLGAPAWPAPRRLSAGWGRATMAGACSWTAPGPGDAPSSTARRSSRRWSGAASR